MAIERAEPHERARRARSPGRQGGKPWLQRKPRLISEIAGQIAALAVQFPDPLQCRRDFIGAARDDDFHRIAIEPGVAGAFGAGVVKKDERGGDGNWHGKRLLAMWHPACKKPLAKNGGGPYSRDVRNARSSG